MNFTDALDDLIKGGKGSGVKGHKTAKKTPARRPDKASSIENDILDQIREFHPKAHSWERDENGEHGIVYDKAGKKIGTINESRLNSWHDQAESDNEGSEHTHSAEYSIHDRHLNKVIKVLDKHGIDFEEIENMGGDERNYRLHGDRESLIRFLLSAGHKKSDVEDYITPVKDKAKKSESEDIEKAGEGSRGGKIIGHTRTGKPIYGGHANKHPGFSGADHHDAMMLKLHHGADSDASSHRLAGKIEGGLGAHRGNAESHVKEHGLDKKKERAAAGEAATARIQMRTEGSGFKSEGGSMDIFKGMGITVGEAPSLLANNGLEIKSDDMLGGQIIRKGQGKSCRDVLEEQLSKGIGMPITTILTVPVDVIEGVKPVIRKKVASEGLKNTHGEEFHSDNDKQAEEFVSSEEEIQFSQVNDGLMFLKAMGEKVTMPKKEFVKEHKDLIHTLKTPSKKDDKKEIKEQSEELEKIQAKKAKSETVKDNKRMAKKMVGLHENSPGIAERRRPAKLGKSEIQGEGEGLSSLDELVVDLSKADKTRFQEYTEEWKEKNKKAKKAEPEVNPKKSFVKSAGQGGMVFDFGHITGNPVADNATRLLNQMGDPVQMQTAVYQRDSYAKAIGDYVTKGEQVYMKQPSVFGNVNDEWKGQLEKSTDQQVKEAFEKGELSDDKSAPAIKNDFNKVELTLGGQVIKATSETDAALIEMMKAQMTSDSGDGFVADVSNGGRISVTAGDPIPEIK